MLRICLLVFMSVLPALQVSASTREERAREMAECGYLAVLAAEDATGDIRQNLVRDIADFANLFYAYADLDRPIQGQGVTVEMLARMIADGRSQHARRLTAISQKNALRLSNNILQTCRADLDLLVVKFRADAGLPPEPAPQR